MRRIVLVLCAAMAAPALAGYGPAASLVDAHATEPQPAAQCARVGTDDAVRSLPPSLLPAARAAFGETLPDEILERAVVWRCAEGRVLVCFAGANLPCDKADTRTEIPAADAWCRSHPGAGPVPMVVTGHASVWRWRCNGAGAAARDGAAWHVDPQGFVAGLWRPLDRSP
jgi:hypothetical protein